MEVSRRKETDKTAENWKNGALLSVKGVSSESKKGEDREEIN